MVNRGDFSIQQINTYQVNMLRFTNKSSMKILMFLQMRKGGKLYTYQKRTLKSFAHSQAPMMIALITIKCVGEHALIPHIHFPPLFGNFWRKSLANFFFPFEGLELCHPFSHCIGNMQMFKTSYPVYLLIINRNSQSKANGQNASL